MADGSARRRTGQRCAAGVAKRFKTLMGRPAARIFLAYQAQLTACSGKTPVCLKPVGLTMRVSLSSLRRR